MPNAPDQARRASRNARDRSRQRIDPNHVHDMAFDHARWLREQGEFETSRRILERVSAERKALHGDDAYLTQVALSQLGRTLRCMEEYERALTLHENVLASRRRVYGDAHEYTLNSTGLLVETLVLAGRTDAARELLEVAAQREPVAWKEHLPELLRSLESAEARNLLILHESAGERSDFLGQGF